MTQKIINTGTADTGNGDPIRTAFGKVNDNFTELYTALGLDNGGINLGAFEFTGSTMSTTDSSAIVIDQAVTVASELTMQGDIVPNIANEHNLGSAARPWKSLYVSNNTIYIGGNSLGVDNNGSLTWNGSTVAHADGEFIRLDALTDVNLGSPQAGDVLSYQGGYWTAATVDKLKITDGVEVTLVGGPGVADPFVTFPAITGGDQLQIQGAEVSTIAGNLALTSVTDINIISNGSGAAPGGSKNWTFSADGSVTIPGDIRSEGNINIDINLSDSTLRRWQFGEDGDLELPQDGGIVFDRADTTIRVGMGFHIASGEGISLDAIDQTAILTLSGAGNGPVNQTYNKTNNTLYTGNDNSSVTVENLGGTWFVFIDGDAKYTSNDLIGWALSTGPGPVPVGVLSNSYKSWVFSPTGNLTFPDGTTTTGDTVISTSTYDIQSIGNTLIRTNTTVGAKTWTFGTDGSLTLPGAVVKSTVAKTGVILPTITGIAESLTHNSGLTGLTDAQYGPFTLGTVTFSVAVNGGVINNFVSVSSTANVTINDVLGTIDSGDIGGTAGALTITVTVNGVVQATPTALDLTKTVNVIGTNHYGLADGVEGQIMYFVPSSTHGNTSDAYILVSNARTVITGVGMSNITDYSWTPFTGESLEPTTIAMAIFADGAWCLRGGASN